MRYVVPCLLLACMMAIVVMLACGVRARAETAPYQVYRIGYGCLYVVTGGPGGGVAAVVAPAVDNRCQ